jgi:hypothetical protein
MIGPRPTGPVVKDKGSFLIGSYGHLFLKLSEEQKILSIL